MTELPLIVGAGPTGLAAALFLAERGLQCRIIDQAATPARESRAQVVNPRALELLESTGVAAAILTEAHSIHRTVFYEGWAQITDLEFGEAHPRYRLSVLPQARTEALLAEALAKRGLQPERGVCFDSLVQDDDGLKATLVHPDGRREVAAAPVLLAADGAHSKVRDAVGISFDGSSFTEPWPLYDIVLNDPLDLESAHVSFVKEGLMFMLGIRPGLWRVFGNVQRPLDRLPVGTILGEVRWTSTFHVGHRQASRAACGRVLLAGDAAHIHSPVAARGMNLGIEDAYVFAACAVDALRGQPERLEDYGRLRHAVHHSVISRVKRLTELARGQPDLVGVLRRYLIPGMTHFPPSAHAMVDLLTGLDHPIRVQ